jgi:hypothetical protein
VAFPPLLENTQAEHFDFHPPMMHVPRAPGQFAACSNHRRPSSPSDFRDVTPRIGDLLQSGKGAET